MATTPNLGYAQDSNSSATPCLSNHCFKVAEAYLAVRFWKMLNALNFGIYRVEHIWQKRTATCGWKRRCSVFLPGTSL
jgi:hypothetical protein